jgi:hypothetical protein
MACTTITRAMAGVLITTQREQDMSATGWTTNSIAKELRPGQKVARIKGAASSAKKEGHGQYKWSDGSMYTGEWKDSRITGLGSYIWADGREYYGYFVNNKMVGLGVYLDATKNRYEGYY